MSKVNRKIALHWAKSQITSKTRCLLSDRFFEPFTHTERQTLKKDLRKQGMIGWPLGEHGAVIFSRAHPGFEYVTGDGMILGYLANPKLDTITMLPACEATEVLLEAV